MPERKHAKEPERALPRRLYRSEHDRIIAGVAGGLGDFFNIDSTIVRILFVILTIFGGSGILLYLLLWLVIPSESDVKGSPSGDQIKRNVNEMKYRAEKFAGDVRGSPARLTGQGRGTERDEARSWFGLIILGLGLFFLLSTFGIISGNVLGKLWPLILVGVGLAILMRR